MTRWLLAAALVAGGCTTTVGPYVDKVATLPDGRLYVRKCSYEVTVVLGIVSGQELDCVEGFVEPRAMVEK
jgi:hypothetical protein